MNQVLLHEIFLFLSVFSSSEVLGKNAFGVNFRLWLAGLGKETDLEEGVKPTCFMSKVTFFETTDKSFTVFFAR